MSTVIADTRHAGILIRRQPVTIDLMKEPRVLAPHDQPAFGSFRDALVSSTSGGNYRSSIGHSGTCRPPTERRVDDQLGGLDAGSLPAAAALCPWSGGRGARLPAWQGGFNSGPHRVTLRDNTRRFSRQPLATSWIVSFLGSACPDSVSLRRAPVGDSGCL